MKRKLFLITIAFAVGLGMLLANAETTFAGKAELTEI